LIYNINNFLIAKNSWQSQGVYLKLTMIKILFCRVTILLFLFLFCTSSYAQDYSGYIKRNAINISNPEQPGDSIYKLLKQYNIIMMGEMHGTNEPAEFVISLARMFLNHGDSVQVGLEIPPNLMKNYTDLKTDSSVYQSDFFSNPPYLDGRESFAWAKLINQLNNNVRVHIFFFDQNSEVRYVSNRDSSMSTNIKDQYNVHPNWKLITICGNVHNRIMEENRAGWNLTHDSTLDAKKICSLNHYYLEGYCTADFGKGLQVRQIVHEVTVYDTLLGFKNYLLLMPVTMGNAYTGFYYTKTVSPADMVKDNFDLTKIKKQLSDIYERDQKTRAHGDSAKFMSYIDSLNLIQVERLIKRYGWPGISLFGNRANAAVFLVIQHADSAVQSRYLPMLEFSVAAGESNAYDMAMMKDRLFMRRGVKQIYGSQVIFNKTGGQEFYPIEDEKNVNKLRAKVGLEPIEDYAKKFGIEYTAPK
jgi:hypothetical protein